MRPKEAILKEPGKERATLRAVESKATCGPLAFAVPGLWRVLSSLVLAVVTLDNPVSQAADSIVTIRPDVRHQTILGWSGMPWYPNVSAQVRDEVLDEAVSDLGLTWVHWTVPSGNRSNGRAWEWTNDDADPTHIHWPAFGTEPVDRSIRTWVLPFKQRVAAHGDRFGMAITQTFHNRGSTGSVPVWLLESPTEFAEYATSLLLYLKNTHGLGADYYVICKDAGDSADNPFEVAVVAEMIKSLGPRLRALGLSTTVLFPEGHDANTCWRFIQAVRADDDLWLFVGMIGYHLYGGAARNTERPKIRDFAVAKGLPISHAGSDGITLDTLYDDLTLGDVSYWSIVGLGGPGPGGAFDLHLDNASFSRGTQYWQYRQVMHYVRPGAVRIEAASDGPAIRPLAFVYEGRTTMVLINNTPPRQSRSATLRNLPPGDYGVCRCVGAGPYEELGVQGVDVDGVLAINLPADSVLTVYPHLGRNLPPTVVEWKAEPSFLKTPASRVRLSTAAQDPELDRLSYSWCVTGQPPGGKATLADPQSATTEASGLTTPGLYVFTIAIRDGANEVKRNVRLHVYAGNQPPALIDVHNRLPVQVTLPQNATVLRGGALDLEGGQADVPVERGKPAAGRGGSTGDAGRRELPSEQFHRTGGSRVPVRGQRRDKHRLGESHGAGLSISMTTGMLSPDSKGPFPHRGDDQRQCQIGQQRACLVQTTLSVLPQRAYAGAGKHIGQRRQCGLDTAQAVVSNRFVGGVAARNQLPYLLRILAPARRHQFHLARAAMAEPVEKSIQCDLTAGHGR